MAHIVKSFDDELAHLRDRLIQMGQLAISQFNKAIDALVNRSDVEAAKVIAGDDELDRLDEATNDHVVRLLALRSPMADDLRLVITALKMASALERTGDYAVSIARRALALNKLPAMRSSRSLGRMGSDVGRMLADVLDAYGERDADKALAVWVRDREIDEMHSALFRELLTYMMEDPASIAACSHLMFVAKNIERVGDHATNIGEMIHFLVTGRAIEGERPKGDTSSLTSG